MRRAHLALTLFCLSTLAGLSLTTTTSAVSPIADEDELLRNATLVFARVMDTPAAAIPAVVMMRASAIAVVPAAVRDGDRYYGQGVMSARGVRADYWSPPAVVAFEGAIPLDLGAGEVDFVVIAQTRRGLDYLIDNRFANAAAHAIVPGALGHNSPVRIDADLVAYVRVDRYFAGVTIEDWVVGDMTASNAMLYGRPYTTDDIVRGAGFFRVPPAARAWRDIIASYFRTMS
jgi:lipid-binding SYLF domain-containing protein